MSITSDEDELKLPLLFSRVKPFKLSDIRGGAQPTCFRHRFMSMRESNLLRSITLLLIHCFFANSVVTSFYFTILCGIWNLFLIVRHLNILWFTLSCQIIWKKRFFVELCIFANCWNQHALRKRCIDNLRQQGHRINRSILLRTQCLYLYKRCFYIVLSMNLFQLAVYLTALLKCYLALYVTAGSRKITAKVQTLLRFQKPYLIMEFHLPSICFLENDFRHWFAQKLWSILTFVVELGGTVGMRWKIYF